MFIEFSVIEPPGVEPNGVEPNGVEPNGVEPNGIEPMLVLPSAPAAAIPKNVLSEPIQDAQPPLAAITSCHVRLPAAFWSESGTGIWLTFSCPRRIAPTGTPCQSDEAKLTSFSGSA
jgi:hypothetical protein